MRLYYHPLSSNARKVRLAATLLDIPLELHNVELPKGEQRTPEYRAINPMGKVPVLEDGEFILPESAAIMMYLAESKAGNSLYPVERRARAEIHRWLFWAANHWSPPASALAFEKILKKRFFSGEEPDPVQVERQEKLFRSAAQVLDAELAKRSHVTGNTLTLADLAIAPSLESLVELPVQDFAHIQGWLARIRELPAWQETAPPRLT